MDPFPGTPATSNSFPVDVLPVATLPRWPPSSLAHAGSQLAGSYDSSSPLSSAFETRGSTGLLRTEHREGAVRSEYPRDLLETCAEAVDEHTPSRIPTRWPRRPSTGESCYPAQMLERHPACDDDPVRLADLSRLAAELDGVFESRQDGLLAWRYRGRLVARQLDDSHIVIRASFEFRDFVLQSFPETFSVPKRFARHMMVVADLLNGNADAVDDAVIGAWELQSGK